VAVQLFGIKSCAKISSSHFSLQPLIQYDDSTWAFEILALRVVKQFFGLPGFARPVCSTFNV
jgi:hypothetical protein